MGTRDYCSSTIGVTITDGPTVRIWTDRRCDVALVILCRAKTCSHIENIELRYALIRSFTQFPSVGAKRIQIQNPSKSSGIMHEMKQNGQFGF